MDYKIRPTDCYVKALAPGVFKIVLDTAAKRYMPTVIKELAIDQGEAWMETVYFHLRTELVEHRIPTTNWREMVEDDMYYSINKFVRDETNHLLDMHIEALNWEVIPKI